MKRLLRINKLLDELEVLYKGFSFEEKLSIARASVDAMEKEAKEEKAKAERPLTLKE